MQVMRTLDCVLPARVQACVNLFRKSQEDGKRISPKKCIVYQSVVDEPAFTSDYCNSTP